MAKSKKQTTLDSFLEDFSADSEGSGLRPRYEPSRDEVYEVEIIDQQTVSNEWGESTMLICNDEGTEKVWFLKGRENVDWANFVSEVTLPVSVRFARIQRSSQKNADRMVNVLRVKSL